MTFICKLRRVFIIVFIISVYLSCLDVRSTHVLLCGEHTHTHCSALFTSRVLHYYSSNRTTARSAPPHVSSCSHTQPVYRLTSPLRQQRGEERREREKGEREGEGPSSLCMRRFSGVACVFAWSVCARTRSPESVAETQPVSSAEELFKNRSFPGTNW